MLKLTFVFKIFTWGHAYSFQREGKGGGEREGETHRSERETVIGRLWYAPKQIWNPQRRNVLWLGIDPTAFCFTGWCSNQLRHTVLDKTDSFFMGFYLKKQKLLRLLSSPTIGFITNHNGISVHVWKKELFSWNREKLHRDWRAQQHMCVRFRGAVIVLT